MILRLSALLLRTLRDDPSDAEVPSHRLLVRAGYVRRVAPGIFSWLPLGYLVYRNVEAVIRDEMNRAGFQEVHFPALIPKEPYQATNRWTEYGDNLFRLQDRRGGDYLLGPTHEELFTLMMKGEVSSYKDLPMIIYQIQTKYRDEARPRAGILRGREFVMKDSYSFDIDDAGLALSYQRHRDAYISTFDRLGLDYVIVSAMSGAMGGSASEEFLAPTPVGEDTFVRCQACGFAANVEAIAVPVTEPQETPDELSHVEDTPNTPTIETLVEVSNSLQHLARSDGRQWQASDTLKNVLVVRVDADGKERPLAIGVPGDREVDERRLEAALFPAHVRAFEEDDFAAHPTLIKGYIGPGVLGAEGKSGIEYLLDPRVAVGTAWITGANEGGRHVYGLVHGRDFHADGVLDVANVKEHDPCPECSQPVTLARGIEIGHIFQLGRKYADALGLQVQDDRGDLVTVTMGSYGIGVSRAVAAIAEQHHDAKGLMWPREIAPADVHVIAMGKDDPPFTFADALSETLSSAGIRVLLDDRRGVSPGVKFNDSELLGVPTIVVVGKGLASGVIEIRDRRSGDQTEVASDGIVDHLLSTFAH